MFEAVLFKVLREQAGRLIVYVLQNIVFRLRSRHGDSAFHISIELEQARSPILTLVDPHHKQLRSSQSAAGSP